MHTGNNGERGVEERAPAAMPTTASGSITSTSTSIDAVKGWFGGPRPRSECWPRKVRPSRGWRGGHATGGRSRRRGGTSWGAPL